MNALGISFFQTFFSQIFCLPIFLPFLLPFVFWLSYSVLHVLPFMFCLLCSVFHLLPFMFCLLCSAFHVLPFMFCLSYSAKSMSPPVCGHDKSSMCLIYCNEDMQQNFYGHKKLVCQLRNKSTWANQRSFNQIGNLEFCNHKSHRSFHIWIQIHNKKRRTSGNLEDSYSLLWDFF